MSQRESLLNKIRALLSKTVENGATEAEALAALDKARAMMDAYEVTEADLQLTKEQAAVIRRAATPNDKHNIRRYLAHRVAEFCDCKVWLNGNDRNKSLTFCGQPSDIDFAEWLLDTLHQFVQGELANHLLQDISEPKWRRRKINGFVIGCTERIKERLYELTLQSRANKRQAVSSNSNALVVIKDRAIDDAMKAAGIKLRTVHSNRRSDDNSRRAGYQAGNRATFGRPVGERVSGYLE